MTTENKNRKNTDYSASAVNLTNSIELVVDLRAYHGLTNKIADLQAKMESFVPQELKDLMKSLQTQLNACTQGIKCDIDKYGSYQDLESGVYALKQRKVSVSYNASAFESCFPEYAPAVIVKAVDVPKVKALLKGGLLTEAGLKNGGITSETESFAYIIK